MLCGQVQTEIFSLKAGGTTVCHSSTDKTPSFSHQTPSSPPRILSVEAGNRRDPAGHSEHPHSIPRQCGGNSDHSKGHSPPRGAATCPAHAPLPLPAPQGTFPTPPGALPPSPPEMSPCSPSQHMTTTLYPLLAPSPGHLAAPPPKPHPATTSKLLSRGVSPLPPIPSTPSRPCASPCPASRFPRSVRQTHPRRCTPLPTGRPRRRAAASPHWGDSSR